MHPVVLLVHLHRAGLELEPDAYGARLLVGPRGKITPGLRSLIKAHRDALLDLIAGKPTRAELELLVATLTSFGADEIKVLPAGPRSIGPFARCSRHHAGTWVYVGDRPACRRCELGLAAEPAPLEPPRLSEWFIRHCSRRGLDATSRRSKKAPAPLIEQIAAALTNGPKSSRQLALELDVPITVILHALDGRAVLDEDGGLRMTEFPDEDEETDT